VLFKKKNYINELILILKKLFCMFPQLLGCGKLLKSELDAGFSERGFV
jgi:hypothetical protein